MKPLLYRENENNMTTKRTFFSLRKLTIGLVPVTFAVLATVHTKHVRADARRTSGCQCNQRRSPTY